MPILPTLQLPAAPENFQGRDDVVRQAVDLLNLNEQARVFMSGPGGIGKTSLALTVVHNGRVVNRFGSRRYWVPCDQAPSAAAFIQLVARSLEVVLAPGSRDPFKDLVSSLRASQQEPRLLILDNFETTWDTNEQPEVDQILCNLSALPGISILMTTRDTESTAFSLDWSRPPLPPLGQLPLEAARAAYLHRLPEAIHDDQLDALLLAIDCYPLAIKLMVSQGELGENPTSLLKRWEAEESKLLTRGRDKGRNLEVSIELSLKSGSMRDNPGALEVLSILALLPAGATIDMLPQIPDLPHHLDTLIKASLASRRTPSRITTLSPIRAYVLRQHPPSQDLLARLCSVYYQLIDRWVATVRLTDADSDPVKAITQEIANIESVLRYSIVNGDQRRTLDIVVGYAFYLRWFHLNPGFLQFVLQQVVDSPNVRLTDRAYVYRLQAAMLGILGKYQEALEPLRTAASLFQAAGDQVEMGRSLLTLGEFLQLNNRLAESGEMIRAAQETFDAIGAFEDVARCQIMLGARLGQERRYPEAKERFQAALSYFDNHNLPFDAATTRLLLGDVLRNESGNHVEQAILTEQALVLFQQLGDKVSAAHCLGLLGMFMYVDGRVLDARKNVELAIAAYREVGVDELAQACERRLQQWSLQ